MSPMVVRLLIVDDEHCILDLLDNIFLENGFEVHLASSVEEARIILDVQKIDIIISDFNMPREDGIDLLNFVNKLNQKPLFYFFSGQAYELKSRKEELGFQEAFLKPDDLQKLITYF